MALNTMTELPRAMLIDMDDTILSAYSRPDLAWNIVATEFAGELAPLSPQQVAAAIVDSGRKFWATAEAVWRLKLEEARHVVVQGGFNALAADGHAPLSLDLATRLANRFHAYREEQMFVFPGAHDAIDEFKARGVKLALVTNGAAGPQRAKVERFALAHRFDISRSKASTASASRRSVPICTPWKRSASRRARRGWSATIWNGRSRRRSASVSTPCGSTSMATACPPDRRSSPTASFAR
jgi:phosphoglycolate phosphatase-like HAD superfamily hydrolase